MSYHGDMVKLLVPHRRVFELIFNLTASVAEYRFQCRLAHSKVRIELPGVVNLIELIIGVVGSYVIKLFAVTRGECICLLIAKRDCSDDDGSALQ